MPRNKTISTPHSFYHRSLLGLIALVCFLLVFGIGAIFLLPQLRITSDAADELEKKITLVASDKAQIAATLIEPSGTPVQAVVLAPMMDGSREDWRKFELLLREHDRVALAFDWRSHPSSSEGFAMQDWPLLEQDLRAAVNYLKAHYPSVPIVMIGASLGANFSIKTALAAQPTVAGAILLSPGVSYRGIDISVDIARYAQPLLLVVSEEDEYAASSSLILFNDSVSSSKSLKRLSDAGHGTMMLQKEPRLGQDLINWMAQLE